MKTSVHWSGTAGLAVLVWLFLFCCSDPVTNEPGAPEEKEEELTPDESDAALGSFAFTSATKVNGSVPAVINTSQVRTDNGDTIYALPGIKGLIRLSHPQSRPIKGVYFAAKGSTFYYDVTIDEEEESDTVSVILFEIEPDEIDVPYDIPVEITAYDGSNQPIDIITRIITVEDPADKSCSILQPGDTANVDNLHGWHWRWSVLLDMNDQPITINAPGQVYINAFKYQACCIGTSCPTIIFEEGEQKVIYDKEFDVSTYYSIIHEWFEFYTNGTFYRNTIEKSSGISNATDSTDWCSEEPVVSNYFDDVYYYGTHDYAPGDASILYGTTRSVCADPLGLCGYGSRGGQVIASCHAMIISTNLEGQRGLRMYTRQYGSPEIIDVNGVKTLRWSE